MTDRIKDIKDLLKMAKGISSKIAGTSSTSLRLDCLSNIGVQTTTIHAGNPFARWVRGMVKDEVKFDPATVYNVRIIEMRPSMREIPGAVHRSDDVLTIDFKECLKSEMFRLEIQYRMEGDYLKSLVDSRSSPEPFEQETKYKLSAQLIDPHSLIEGFSEVDVNEYPVTSSVYVRENIDTAIPGLETLRELRKLEEDMFTNYDPRAGFKLASQQHKRFALRRQLREQNPREVLRALNMLLLPAHFRIYFRMEEDFRYYGCNWGPGKLEMAENVFIPEEMQVITRTDLGLSKVAAHGIMHYDVGKFKKDVEDAIEKKRRVNDVRRNSKAG